MVGWGYVIYIMKILTIGDQHFRLDLPYADYVKDRRLGEKSSVLEAAREASKDCDAVVLIGDGLHLRHNHSTVIKDFVEFICSFAPVPLYVIAGNHEIYNGTETAIDFLKKADLPNVKVITAGPERCDLGGKKVVFLPYCTNAALGVESYEDGVTEIMRRIDAIVGTEQFDAIFLHHAISGSKTVSGGLTDLFGEIVLSREELEKRFKTVVGGHIHAPQQIGRTVVTGSLFTAEVGEEKKSLWKTDLDTGDIEEIALPVRAIRKFDVSTPEDIAALEAVDPYSIVKCIVHSKEIDVDAVREKLQRFDAYILIEDYPSERQKVRIDDGAMEDLSVENLLRIYAKQNNIEELDLIKAFDIVRK